MPTKSEKEARKALRADLAAKQRREFHESLSMTDMLFADLADAAEVLVSGTTDEARRVRAAKTLYNLQNTEILDFIVREVCSADTIESLFKECLDGDGFPLKKPRIGEFDIRKYI
jgi:hypothetical protein